ncbi:MAG: hypothetical protein GY731_01190 [Gammaproteobacteria bacterium]|nr:hypothetical protein [Gammaproteobacteria bacterium]
MVFINAIKAYQGLDPRQRRLLGHKLISGNYTPKLWLKMFKGPAVFDLYGDAARKFSGWLAVGGLIVLVLFLFFGATLLDALGLGGGYMPLLGLLAGVVILCGIMYFVFKGKDLPNNLRDFVYPLIKIIGEDMKPDVPLHISLNLRGGMDKEKRKDERNQSEGTSRYPKILEQHYLDPWFSGSARLADGTSLKWRVVDRIRARKITKRNHRGKIKVKHKYKIQRRMEVIIGIRQDRYQTTKGSLPKDVQMDVEVRNNRNLLRFTRLLEKKKSDLMGRTKDIAWVVDLNQFLDLIAVAYRDVERRTA